MTSRRSAGSSAARSSMRVTALTSPPAPPTASGSPGSGGYALVILDLIMPDMDGRTVLGAILWTHPAQAVLILSCTADPGTKAECLDFGAKDYLTKPFSLAELTARVRARLREAALRSEVMQVGDLTLDAAAWSRTAAPGRCP